MIFDSYFKEIKTADNSQRSSLVEKFINEFYNADYVFYKENMPKIVIAELGNDAGIIGSALYA